MIHTEWEEQYAPIITPACPAVVLEMDDEAADVREWEDGRAGGERWRRTQTCAARAGSRA